MENSSINSSINNKIAEIKFRKIMKSFLIVFCSLTHICSLFPHLTLQLELSREQTVQRNILNGSNIRKHEFHWGKPSLSFPKYCSHLRGSFTS